MADDVQIGDVGRVVEFGKLVDYEGRIQVLMALHREGPASAYALHKAGIGNLADLHYHCRKLVEFGAARAGARDDGIRRSYELSDYGRNCLRAAAIIGKKP